MSSNAQSLEKSFSTFQYRYTVKVEVKAASSTQARLGMYARAHRVWIRIYDFQGTKTDQIFIGFIDTRYTGPRSYAYRVLQDAYQQAERICAELDEESVPL